MADVNEREDVPRPGPAPLRVLDILQIVFLAAGCSGVFFTVNGPAKNEAQALFRLGVMVVGGIGLLVVTVLKLTSRRRP
jgi:hypothetical protein